MTSVTPLGAQDTTRTSPDSLAARLERAEEAIAFLRQQMADEAATSVRARSRTGVEITARVLINAFANSRNVNNVDVPVFVRPDTNTGLPAGGGGMSIRQTTLGFAVASNDVLGGSFAGNLDVDFYGGQQPSSGGRTFPLVRMRIARATLSWPNADVMIGQDAPLVSQLNPVSLASVGVPGFTAAGNLWLWLPQARLGVHTTGAVRFGMEGAVLAPTSGDPTGLFDTDNDIAERSRRPFVEGRAHVTWGEGVDEGGSIGIGAHDGWFATPNAPLRREGRAITADARFWLGHKVEVRGEWYDGDGVRGLGGGAIGQLFGTSGAPIHSTGGWGQVNVSPNSWVLLGAGYGFDDPDDGDLSANGRLRNTATELHLHVRPAGPLMVGFEYRRLETTYRTAAFGNDHLNVAVGWRM